MADVRAALLRVLAGVALLALELLDPVQQRRDLPVREPGHRLADRAGEVDREVEVDQPGVDQPDQRRQRPDVAPGERRRALPCSGKPSARQSRCACSRSTPVSAASSTAVKTGSSPRMALLEVLAGRPSGRGWDSEAAQTPSSRASSVCSSWSRSLSLRWVSSTRGMSGSGDLAVRARVADHQRAAAEQPVDEVLLVGDVADPGQRDVVAAPGDHAVPGDQPAGGDRVGRGEPDQERPEHEPDDADRHDDPDDQRDDVLGRSCVWTNVPMASSTTSARIGSSSALGWVRVLTTMRLALVEQVLGDGHGRIMSLDRPDGVSRTCTTSPAPTRCARRPLDTTSRPLGSMPIARPVSVSPRREGDADVAADRGARRGVRRRPAGSRPPRRPPARRRTPPRACRGAGRAARSGRGPSPADRQRRRLGDRQLVGGHADVEPDPDHRGRAGRRSRPARPGSRRPCGPLAEEDVVRPLHRRRRTRPPAAPCSRRSPVSSGSHGHGGRRHGRPQQHREGQRRARRRLPDPVEPAAARRSGARRRPPGPPGAPAWARSATSALVEPASSTTST